MLFTFPSYFSQTLRLLEEDESIYCISAWNDQVSRNIFMLLHFFTLVYDILFRNSGSYFLQNFKGKWEYSYR